MLRVGVNLLWLVPGRVGGSETATVALLREMVAHPPGDVELALYALDAFGERYPDLVRAVPTHLVPLTGRVRPLRVAVESSWLVRRARGHVDLVHHPGGVLPPVSAAAGVVTVHDLQPFDMPENFTAAKRTYLQRTMPRTVRRAAAVLVPSAFVRQGIVDRFGVPPERVHVTHWGVEPPTNAVAVAEVQARYGLPRRWFVFPSFTWHHKNHLLLLRAFATVAARQHDVMLVLTGGEGPAEQAVADEVLRLGLRWRVRRTGLVPRRDVLAIVRGAVALTWPSRYEGFGLPVVEGMRLGTPVLSSDAAALPEVAGDAALMLPADDTDAWTQAMLRMLDDGDERRRLAAAGSARARGFTWARAAATTVAAYRAAVAASPDEPAEPGVAPADAVVSPDEPAEPGVAPADAVVSPDEPPEIPHDDGVAP